VGVKDVLRSFVDSRGEWDRSFFYTNFEVSRHEVEQRVECVLYASSY